MYLPLDEGVGAGVVGADGADVVLADGDGEGDGEADGDGEGCWVWTGGDDAAMGAPAGTTGTDPGDGEVDVPPPPAAAVEAQGNVTGTLCASHKQGHRDDVLCPRIATPVGELEQCNTHGRCMQALAMCKGCGGGNDLALRAGSNGGLQATSWAGSRGCRQLGVIMVLTMFETPAARVAKSTGTFAEAASMKSGVTLEPQPV